MQHFDSWLRFSAGGVGIDNVEPARVDAEFVLEHQGYVARLARSLVFDAALADDLSQQIWLAALKRPPAHGQGLRGWLSTIARNLAASSHSKAARREEHEQRGAKHEAVAAADDLLQREQVRTDLVSAVLALDEPFREAIILRYFDEL
jgi:RNA polymerase sigma factor (sigma-70 family)